MLSDDQSQISHYTIDNWDEISKSCTSPEWTNDLSKMEIDNSWMFDPSNEHSLARTYNIDGLGLVLASLENGERKYVLRDKQGFWYYIDEETAGLWAFEEKLEVSDLAGDLRFSVGPNMKAERGEMINCSDTSQVIPVKRPGRQQAKEAGIDGDAGKETATAGQANQQ